MNTPMKNSAPNALHLAFRKALEEAMRTHGATLQADELLAVMSHCVGQLIALQDQRKMTPAMAMDLVSSNIEQGNREVVLSLLTQTGGNA
jgi:hypothetical protein